MTEMVVLPEDAEIIGALRGALIKLLPPGRPGTGGS